MKFDDVYDKILRDTIKGAKNMEELDILLHAVVIRSFAIALPDGVELEDVWVKRGGRIVLEPPTRWGVAAMLAALWPASKERGQEEYWHDRYVKLTPYEGIDAVPDHLRERALAAKASIEAHPLVAELVLED